MEVVRHGRGKRLENAYGLKPRQEFDSLSLRFGKLVKLVLTCR
jgi:hypothetical protein